MIARISKHQIGKYRLQNGIMIDAIVLGDESGYRAVVPISIRDGSTLTHVRVDFKKGNPHLYQTKAVPTNKVLYRANCVTKVRQEEPDKLGYGTLYIKKGLDDVKILQSGHCKNEFGRKHNDALIVADVGSTVIVRNLGEATSFAYSLRFSPDPAIVSKFPAPKWNIVTSQYIDMFAKENMKNTVYAPI